MPIIAQKNILKIVLCIETTYIDIWSKFHVFTVIIFDVTPKPKSILLKFGFAKIVFLLFFPTRLKTFVNFFFDPSKYQLDSPSYRKK